MASVQHSPLNQIPWSHPVCLQSWQASLSPCTDTYLQLCWDWSCVPHQHISRAEKETLNPSMTRAWYLGQPDNWRGWETGAEWSSFGESPPPLAARCFNPGDFPWHHSHPHQLCSVLGEKPSNPGMHLLRDELKCILTMPLDHAQLWRTKPCAVQGHSWSEVQADPHCGLQDNCIITKPQAWLSNGVDRLGVNTLPSKGCLFAGLFVYKHVGNQGHSWLQLQWWQRTRKRTGCEAGTVSCAIKIAVYPPLGYCTEISRETNLSC